MKCAVCKGSGIAFPSPVSKENGSIQMKGLPCRSCAGTGYLGNRLNHRDSNDSNQMDIIGRVIQYHPGEQMAKLSLDESLHVGTMLLIEDGIDRIEFVLSEIIVSQMRMGLALAGWVVVIRVPKEVSPGTRIYRAGA